ncbi:MAG: hypothetical protein AAFQ43_14590 [Bacteroidota bacterium]
MKTSTPAQSLQAYFDAWNSTDTDVCSGHLFAGCAQDVVVLDPHADRPVQGWAAVASHIAFFRERSEHRLEPTTEIDVHHGVCRVGWRLASGDEVLSTGELVADAASDGRLQRVVHFVDAPPPEASPSPN